jgi:hypothetical protein
MREGLTGHAETMDNLRNLMNEHRALVKEAQTASSNDNAQPSPPNNERSKTGLGFKGSVRPMTSGLKTLNASNNYN